MNDDNAAATPSAADARAMRSAGFAIAAATCPGALGMAVFPAAMSAAIGAHALGFFAPFSLFFRYRRSHCGENFRLQPYVIWHRQPPISDCIKYKPSASMLPAKNHNDSIPLGDIHMRLSDAIP
jgi:hypothetical protein